MDKNSFVYLSGEEPEQPETEEKKPVPKAEDPLSERFLKTRTILINGEIEKDLAERVIKQVLIMDNLSRDPITILIDSPGGDVYSGFSIYDIIRFVSAPVRVIGMGLVASAAALIFLAVPKERRFGFPNSSYLIHQPLSGIQGVATEIEIHARELEKTKARLNEIISEATGQSLERVAKDTDRDYWMNAKEAEEYGILSKIVTRRDELAC